MRRCLSFDDRLFIKKSLEQGLSYQEIAKQLGVHISTIYREIKHTENGEYSPNLSQKQYEESKRNCGGFPILKKEKSLAKKISHLIINEHLSPKKVLQQLSVNEKLPIRSVRTIYNAIDAGLIPNVSRETLKPISTNIFSSGLIQLPKWIRDDFGIQDGTVVNFDITDNEIHLTIKKQN